jgi:hypothetical protein
LIMITSTIIHTSWLSSMMVLESLITRSKYAQLSELMEILFHFVIFPIPVFLVSSTALVVAVTHEIIHSDVELN